MKRIDPRIRDAVNQLNLTPRESELVALCCMGLSTEDIAETMGVALNTVRTHLRNIYAYLDVRDRCHMISMVCLRALRSKPRSKRRHDSRN